MGAPSFFVKALIRVANTQGPEVLEAIITGQFSIIQSTGGKQLTGVSAGGKNFSYQVPPGLEIDKLMGYCEEALSIFTACDAEQIAAYLKRRPESRSVARFY
jgi:hypothetical protein